MAGGAGKLWSHKFHWLNFAITTSILFLASKQRKNKNKRSLPAPRNESDAAAAPARESSRGNAPRRGPDQPGDGDRAVRARGRRRRGGVPPVRRHTRSRSSRDARCGFMSLFFFSLALHARTGAVARARRGLGVDFLRDRSTYDASGYHCKWLITSARWRRSMRGGRDRDRRCVSARDPGHPAMQVGTWRVNSTGTD